MINSTHQWLIDKFSQYYSGSPPTFELQIPMVHMREFGFGGWNKKIEFRHLHFATYLDLWKRLRQETPLYISASAAYYEFPAARPMIKKNWLGADIIFDLDAPDDELAPFITLKSLERVKQKAITLIEDFLIPDFGIKKQELHINFSGSRGYHVRVYKKEIKDLQRQERREIVDYIDGIGLDFEDFLSEVYIDGTRFKKIQGPTPNMGGHKGRFARQLMRLAKDPKTAIEISSKLKNKKNSEFFIKGIASGNYSNVQIPHALDKFRELFNLNKLNLQNAVDTDANVTIDTSKILRLPDTIHGGSGLIAKTLSSLADLSNFNPLKDARAFSADKFISIKTNRIIPQIIYGEQTFDPINKDKKIDLPESFAIYLICKKCANPI